MILIASKQFWHTKISDTEHSIILYCFWKGKCRFFFQNSLLLHWGHQEYSWKACLALLVWAFFSHNTHYHQFCSPSLCIRTHSMRRGTTSWIDPWMRKYYCWYYLICLNTLITSERARGMCMMSQPNQNMTRLRVGKIRKSSWNLAIEFYQATYSVLGFLHSRAFLISTVFALLLVLLWSHYARFTINTSYFSPKWLISKN